MNGLKPTLIIVVSQKNENLPAGIQGYTVHTEQRIYIEGNLNNPSV